MTQCIFVSDLHGRRERYHRLFAVIQDEAPSLVFLGGDLLPHRDDGSFINEFLKQAFSALRASKEDRYPEVFLILGNDDPKVHEEVLVEGEDQRLWRYIHGRKELVDGYGVYGYSCVPPTPFQLKDWERYDVSRYVDPGCVSPEEGVHSVSVDDSDVKWGTILGDLGALVKDDNLNHGVFLFHSPPYDTCLDRAALDGKYVDHAALDVHVGSIAIRRFIEERQPLLTLHGHIHEAARITGEWKTTIGRTHCLGAAHDGPELALVRFDLRSPEHATRELLSC